MKTKGISQETLKLIACLTMLLDHTAAVLVYDYWPYVIMRGLGRIAFPIYCFLLAEGAHYTKSPGKYALRLLIGALLSEIPFDLALFGKLTWEYQNVMVTLLLGFGALWAMKRLENPLLKMLVCLPFIPLGELLHTDYGSLGVLLIAMLGLFRDLPMGRLMQCVCVCLVCALIPSMEIQFGVFQVSLELIGILSILPLLLYFGKKHTKNKWVQWAFYLFYPAHLTALCFLV